MGIGSIASTNRLSVVQTAPPDLKDQKSKSIQSKISDVEQQIRKLSSEDDLSVNEKTNEKKKLQKEKSDLNTKLKQHQEELLRSQKRETLLAKMQEDQKPAEKENEKDGIQSKETASAATDKKDLPADDKQAAQPGTVITQSSDGTVILKEVMSPAANPDTDTEEPADDGKEKAAASEEMKKAEDDAVTDTSLSGKAMQAMVSADASLQQADYQGKVVARTEGGIAILKGEIKQDAYRDVDTERKQAELEKMQKQSNREQAFQRSILENADNAMKSAAETNGAVNDKADTENTFYISGLSAPQEEQASQQRFYVSIA